MSEEVMKLASDYANAKATWYVESLCGTSKSYTAEKEREMEAAHTALRETLAEQPAQQQEPDENRCPECGYLTKHTEHIGCLREQLNAINAFEQRNFAIVNMDKAPQPVQRTWAGLTWQDWNGVAYTSDFRRGAEWADAQLREKNT